MCGLARTCAVLRRYAIRNLAYDDDNDGLEPDVPESKKRKKDVYTAPPTASSSGRRKPSPRWLAPLMLTMFGIGVLWLVVFYITQGEMPLVEDLGNLNLLVGFGFIIVGFGLSTQWR